MNQSDFAKVLGIFPAQLSLAVNGKSPLTNQFAFRIRKGLDKVGCSRDELEGIFIK